MILKIDDWKFDVDITATMAYSATEAAEHCTCGYCRNFYAAVDQVYPNLRSFFAQFGINIEAPEELLPYEPTIMDGYYAICGKVIQYGKQPIPVDGLYISVPDTGEANINVFCAEPYFLLNTGLMEFPWVLDEPMDQVVSTANEPSFLQKMWGRLLRLVKNDRTKQ